MSDFLLRPRAALAGKTPVETANISLKSLPDGHVIHVLVKPGADFPSTFGKLSATTHSVRRAAPGQWFIVVDALLTAFEMKQVLESLAPNAAGVDQSHGRIRIAINGPMVERVLAKGTGVDLALSSFPVGYSTTTLVGHIAAHLTRVEEKFFELMVLRSFAESLWDDLVRMSVEARKFNVPGI